MTDHDIEALLKLCYIGKQKMGTKESERVDASMKQFS
jgi:hypothetical protein